MGREGRAADNWGRFPSSRSVEMILLSETERWGVWSSERVARRVIGRAW